MNKRNISERFDFARSCDYQSKYYRMPLSPDGEVQKTPQDTLLTIIYAPDERTGLPTGDIQYYVSDRASEDVKQFILQNLMKDVSAAKNVANPQGLSDDALLELSRGLNESVDDYVLRMQKQVDDFKFIREKVARELAEKNVSPQSE